QARPAREVASGLSRRAAAGEEGGSVRGPSLRRVRGPDAASVGERGGRRSMGMGRMTVPVPPGGPSAPPRLERRGRRAPRPPPTDTPMTLTARHRTRSLAAVGLVLPLALLAACSTGGTDAQPGSGDAAAAEEPAAAPREEATAVPRLAVTYDGGVQVLDA